MEKIPVIYLGLAVLLAVACTAAAVWYMFRVTKGQDQQTMLTSLLFFCMVVITCVYLIDKIISVRTDLLTDNENSLIFELIKGFLLTVTGYTFAIKQNKP